MSQNERTGVVDAGEIVSGCADFSERGSGLGAWGRTDFAEPESVAREKGSGATRRRVHGVG